jgi:acetate---CoA ligase (ADP-forming)
MTDLSALFAPRAVAVLGVSRDPAKLGHRLLENLMTRGFAGALHPVNPSGESILGIETVRRVDDLPLDIDLALVSLPAPAVPAAITSLAARRARAAVILSSGFGEVDAEGRGVEAHVLATARAAGLRLVGPNCMGVYSAPARLNGTYFWDLPTTTGGISVVSQSGAYGGLIFRHLGARALGVARFVSIGNQADVDVAEVLEYLAEDAATSLVACFVEAVRDGVRFLRAATRAAARKPVVVLKGGRSDAGRRAAGSHTGSLAGSYDVFRAACLRAGVVLADETEEFFDAIETLAAVGPMRPAGPAVAILTVSGGPSVVAADAAERAGLQVPALPPGTRAALRAVLPSFAAVGNPVDLTPQVEPARIAGAVRAVVAEPSIAGAIAINVGLDIPEFADAVVTAARATGKPAVAFTADAPRIAEILRAGGVPILASPERAVRAWRALWRARPPASPAVAKRAALPDELKAALGTANGPWSYRQARAVLEAYGVRFCRERTAGSAEDAVAAAAAIGYPVVVKADVRGLTHKTDVGGVVLDVRDADGVRTACATLHARTGATTVVVQERVGPGVELLVGARRDEVFGPTVALGAGGVLTEALQDVSIRIAPVADDEIAGMFDEGARPRLLAGPRGLAPVDRVALAALVRAVGDAVASEDRIREIDLNPVIASGGALVAVDALMIVGDEPRRTEGDTR